MNSFISLLCVSVYPKKDGVAYTSTHVFKIRQGQCKLRKGFSSKIFKVFILYNCIVHVTGHFAEPVKPLSTTATTTVQDSNETSTRNTSIKPVTKRDHIKIKQLNTNPNTYGNRVPGPGFGLGHGYDGEGPVHT